MELYAHQKELINAAPDRYGIFHSMGTGKTLIAIELAKKKGVPTLVLCPKTIKPKWERDMADFPYEHLVLTKEEFKKVAATLKGYPCVIVDESHHWGGVTSQMHKSLLKYLNKNNTPYRYFCTGTVYLSTPWNIYAAAQLMGLNLNYVRFRDTFFAQIRMGHRYIWKAREGQVYKDKLRAIIDRMGSSVQLADVFDVPDQEHEVVSLELSPEQKKLIKENYDPVAIVAWTAQHRIENSGGPKLAWLIEFAKTHPKFIVWCRYLSQMKEYEYALKDAGYMVAGVHGGITFRDALFKVMDRKEHCILFIQAQCSEGYELPGFDTAVYASMSFSYKDKIQSAGRILRANALHKNKYYYLVIKNGVDEEVWRALERKTDFSFALLSKQMVD